MNLFKEIAKNPFEPDDFVERLVRHTEQIPSSKVPDIVPNLFDIGLLYETFTKIISELKVLLKEQQIKCDQLATEFNSEESLDLQRVALLHESNKNALVMIHELDERINYVAAKVIHLGDQLKSVDVPRSKLVEAQKLMYHFDDLCNPRPFLDDIFTDNSRISEAAQLMLKLNSIALELPDDKFSDAKKTIALKYDDVEKNLIEEFYTAQQRNDVATMKQTAHILVHFKGYGQCIDAFIERAQSAAFGSMDMFQDAIPMCEGNYQLVRHIFPNPEQTMAKFVLNLFSLKLQDIVGTKLSDKSDMGRYLNTLFDLYRNALNTTKVVSHYDLGNDGSYLQKLTSRIFQPQLDMYIRNEVDFLKERCACLLEQYYASKSHQKKLPNDTGRFLEFRRDLQAVIGTRANIAVNRDDQFDSTEVLISLEVSRDMIMASKDSFQRCNLLSKPEDASSNAVKLMEVILQHLLIEHIDYAVEISLQTIPLSDSKGFPPLQFFEVIQKTNTVVTELEMFFSETVVPLVRGSPQCADCIAKERFVLEIIENKLDLGLDRLFNAISNWIKLHLPVGQRRADSKSLDKDSLSACHLVVSKIRLVSQSIRSSLDAKNCHAALEELGLRFHRIVVDSIFQCQFNMTEAYNVYIEITEYKRCVDELKVPLVTVLFETLQALWKVLMVPSGNLKQVCSDSQLADLDETVIANFAQLRSDSKKPGNFLK